MTKINPTSGKEQMVNGFSAVKSPDLAAFLLKTRTI